MNGQINNLVNESENSSGTNSAFLVSGTETAELLGVSRSFFYQMHSSGRLGPTPIKFGGKCCRWIREELKLWINAGCPPRGKWQEIKNCS